MQPGLVTGETGAIFIYRTLRFIIRLTVKNLPARCNYSTANCLKLDSSAVIG